MTNRRQFLYGVAGFACVAGPEALARPLPEECRWLLGQWKSDVERSMENFAFQGKRLTFEQYKKISDLFGKMTHAFSASTFSVAYDNHAFVRYREAYRFSVEGFTDSSVSLAFPGHSIPGLTLYRDGDTYFSRAGKYNFEYFKRVPA